MVPYAQGYPAAEAAKEHVCSCPSTPEIGCCHWDFGQLEGEQVRGCFSPHADHCASTGQSRGTLCATQASNDERDTDWHQGTGKPELSSEGSDQTQSASVLSLPSFCHPPLQ